MGEVDWREPGGFRCVSDAIKSTCRTVEIGLASPFGLARMDAFAATAACASVSVWSGDPRWNRRNATCRLRNVPILPAVSLAHDDRRNCSQRQSRGNEKGRWLFDCNGRRNDHIRCFDLADEASAGGIQV
jgi:hypothetical protein